MSFIDSLKETKDYQIFSTLDLNRPIKSRHVRKIQRLISLYGLLYNVVCVKTDLFSGTEQLYIVDGQHRFKALKDLDMAVPYIIVDVHVDSKRQIASLISGLNTSSDSWSLADFLHAWTTIGIDSYMIVSNKYETSGISLSYLIHFYSLQQSGGRISRKFKEGEFEIPNLELSLKLIQAYQEAIVHMDFEHWTEESRFVDWIISNHPNKTKLVNVVKKNKIRTQFVKDELDNLYYK